MGIRDWLRSVRKGERMQPDLPSGIAMTNVPQGVEQGLKSEGMETGGPFAPGRPLNPFFGYPQAPRQWDYPVGYNIAERPRASEGKVSFETMRNLLSVYDVARICIERREDEIRGLDWSIVPAVDAPDQDWSSEIRQVTQFFERPDGFTPFDSWLSAYIDDVLAYDAGSIYIHRTRAGKLGALEVVDGTTIAPLIDYWGRPPNPPAPAFVQYVQGMPAVWLQRDDLVYQPYRALTSSPYGMPPIEWLLMTINTDIRWQWHFLLYFTEGSVPDTFMEAPPDLSSPEQIQMFQAAWDAVMEGDQSQKHKVRWVPAGSRPTPAKTSQFDTNFPIFLLEKTCAAYKMTPQEIGFTQNANRANSDSQENIMYRASLVPFTRYIDGILTRIIRHEFGLPLAFKHDVGGEKEDKLVEAQSHKIYVELGAESVDEVRQDVLGLPVDKSDMTPRFIMTTQGPLPLGAIGSAPAAPVANSVAVDDDRAVMEEIARWRENARNRMKQGKPPKRFVSDVIPDIVAHQIWTKLERAETMDDVNEAFSGPFLW